MRLAVLGWVVVLSLGCGPVVSDEQQSDTGAANDETSDGDSVEETGLGETGGGVGTTSGESTSGVETTSALDPLVRPENVYVALRCDEGRVPPGPHLWMEVYLDDPEASDCLPAPGVSLDEILLVWISQWDGQSGTFTFGDEHPHRASLGGTGDEYAEGTVSVVVDAPYALVSAHLDLHTSTHSVVGDLDFTLCPLRLGDPRCR
jgi:hypothetical protein